ncbi:hypothetical protein ACHAXA_005755 [Cyclostephanos tholiformis]|uniref:Uncharacterized protein n=1 Tax=Cyclostephanos tholiformis TaxID=382380 RepID=A0ABD3RSI5_9STRA
MVSALSKSFDRRGLWSDCGSTLSKTSSLHLQSTTSARRIYKLATFAALVASASAFVPAAQIARTTAINQELGKGGMADTRDPEPYVDEDPRKSISAAPSFEEYLKQRQAEGK